MKKNEIEILSQNQHVLKRTGRYVGSIKHISLPMFLIEDDKFVYKTVEFVPGLLKIIREIIDNSCDEFVRTKGKFGTVVKINIEDDGTISVLDNGRGIPIEKIPSSELWAPEAAWTELRAGSNFKDEDDNVTIGQNGEGAALSCILSKKFIGETADGKKKFKIICENNLESKKIKITDSSENYTEVTMLPDYERFGMPSGLDDIHKNILKADIFNLAMSYPDITFYFNKEKVKIRNFKNYMEMFGTPFEAFSFDNFNIGIALNSSDDFNYICYINGSNCYEGGNPFIWAINSLINPLSEKLSRSCKSIKPGDIKNKLTLAVFFKNMPNPRFDNQMKTKCINVPGDFKDIVGSIDFSGISQKIFRNKEIVDPIVEMFKIKEEWKSRQELGKLEKSTKKMRCDKFLSATKSNEYFVLCEGDSAQNSVASVLGREKFGYYSMRGVPLNGYSSPLKKISENKELVEIISLLGLSFDPEKNLTPSFSNIVGATDYDLDGFKIFGLLVGFFYRFAPHVIEEGRLKRFRTPIIVLKQHGKVKHHFFTFDEYNEFAQKYEINKFEVAYKKGLGSWKKEELVELIKEFGFEYFIQTISKDDSAKMILDHWFKDEFVDKRKEYLRLHSFSIFNI